MNFDTQIMSKQMKRISFDGILKRVHTEVSCLSSSDDQSMKSQTTTKAIGQDYSLSFPLRI